MSGDLHFAKDTKVAYFAQHQLEQLNVDATALQHLRDLAPEAQEGELRSFLGGFGFHGDRVFEQVGPFSGGEKARLVLALLVYQKPNLLLLDEPSNHLDIQMRHALTVALQDYNGGIVLISHDRHLLKMACDKLLLVHDGRVDEFDGDIDGYPAWLQKQSRPASAGKSTTTVKPDKDKKRQEAEHRQRLAPLRKEITSLEKQLDRLQRKNDELQTSLADESIYDPENKDLLKDLLWQQAELAKATQAVEEEWMEKAEQLEQAQQN